MITYIRLQQHKNVKHQDKTIRPAQKHKCLIFPKTKRNVNINRFNVTNMTEELKNYYRQQD